MHKKQASFLLILTIVFSRENSIFLPAIIFFSYYEKPSPDGNGFLTLFYYFRGRTMVNSVKKATDILQILSNNPGTCLTLGSISQLSGINESTCAHIVNSLCETFFIERVSRKEGYRLGPWAYMLSRKERYQESLIKISEPILTWLHEQLNVTVFLDVICNGRKFVLFYIDDEHRLLNSGDSIIQGKMETTASGLLHMAYMDKEDLRKVLSREIDRFDAGQNGLPYSDLDSTLSQIRSTGYVHVENNILHEQSFAFKVSDGFRNIAAVGVVYSNTIENSEFHKKVMKLGKQASAEISRRLPFAR